MFAISECQKFYKQSLKEVFSMMTEKQKRTILEMREEGRSYQEIAEATQLSLSSLKVFVSRWKGGTRRRCVQCGAVLPEGARKTQRFCSTRCRSQWWNKHPGEVKSQKKRPLVCSICGGSFTSYKPAKYCSRACYYDSRRKA